MVNLLQKILSKFYNEKLESISTRILYFFNTIDTYFIITGILSFAIIFPEKVNCLTLVLSILIGILTSKIADFYPLFILFAIPLILFTVFFLKLPLPFLGTLFLVNIIVFFIIQFTFMGIPDSIVARDIRVPFIKMYNSLWTVAPTTVSFSMSVFFSFYLSVIMAIFTSCKTYNNFLLVNSISAILFIVALITRISLPKNRFSKFHKPDIGHPFFKRIVVLNIDGVRKDIFDSIALPTIERLKKEGASHTMGLETVYRALTNPAFASIFTGTIPVVHGIRNNNLGQSILTEGLPDIVPSIAYGSMHVKHFCKKYWETRIISLPRHSIYASDDIMLRWLKEDMVNRDEVRLFVADFSEADFLAHAYGSKSKKYKEALQRIDKRIGEFLDWMQLKGMHNDTAIIVCSDHGISRIDHSYLIAKSEIFVPFLLYGKGIKKDYKIQRPGKIMDICCTIAYLLGIRYPSDARGQVFTDTLEDANPAFEREEIVQRINQLKYQTESERYCEDHAEIYEGDSQWWNECISKYILVKKNKIRVLDIGCGAGFVGERFIEMGVGFTEFICMDIAEDLLSKANARLGKYPEFSFFSRIEELHGKFDVITVSSVFHHVVFPEKLARKIDQLLAKDGLVIGSHEPNNRVFRKNSYCIGASFYKWIGGGIGINEEIVMEINHRLKMEYPKAPFMSREEILQIVEYHSPLEQYDKGIDAQSGFDPKGFLNLSFPGYEILLIETYTTFFCRPWLTKHRGIQSFLALLFNLFFHEGNLFRFVLCKKDGDQELLYSSGADFSLQKRAEIEQQ